MPPIHSIAAAVVALAGVGHVSPPHAAQHAQIRPTESVTFALPANHQDPLVAVAYIRGHAVKLGRPKVHGRHAISQLTAREMVKARIENASSFLATARLFADGHKIAQTSFTVPAFGHSATTRHPKKPPSNGGSTSTGTTASTSPTSVTNTGTGTGTGTGTTTIGTTGGVLSQPVSSSTLTPLSWAPPVLTDPTTIDVKSGDPDVINLSTSQDYILKMPATPDIGTIEINGGHNVVLIGGQITVPSTANQTDNGADDTDTAIYVKGSTGTVHIEGMLINGQTNTTMFDGIDTNAPQATVQIENVRMTGLVGSYTYEHSDVIQTWGGVKALRIDDLTADGDYQGLTLKPDIGSVGSGQIQNVDLTADAWPAALVSKSSGGGIMLWLTTGTCTTSPMSFDNVYVQNDTNRIPTGSTVWPTTISTAGCAAQQTGNAVSWPGLPAISGSVTLGAPPNGSFVPAGTVGVGYQTPGYATP